MQNAENRSLSARQAEIAEMIVFGGKSTREIALALSLSARTVETHVAAIYNKYGVASRAKLIAAVLRDGSLGSRAWADEAAKTNLTAPSSHLIGRTRDIENILWTLGENRLITLVGAGGVGKTRAAIAAGQLLLPDFRAGVWLVELAALARGSSVVEALARVLGVEQTRNAPRIETVVAHVGRKTLLLILDNCEHVIGDAAALANSLLRGCPNVRIIATSRESLRISGECVYRLPSLGVPAYAQGASLSAEQAEAFPAIELFAQRARSVVFDFVLSDQNALAVAEICRRLDGIPLAIELAAARLTTLSLNQLAARLQSHLSFLAGGDRTALPRHRTMHALIEWSYDLLDESEQRLFERLSVFAGGCALAEAASVCGSDEFVALELLAALVDKSLVIADVARDRPRYRLLQTFAQFGAEKLAARGEAAEVARRHAAAYVELAERLEHEYDVAPNAGWYGAALPELENWKAAFVWTLDERRDVPLGQRLAAVRPLWTIAEGAWPWLTVASELVDEDTPAIIAARIEYNQAYVAFNGGKWESTVETSRRLVRTFRELGDPLRAAYTQQVAGAALVSLERLDEAELHLMAALETARAHARSPLIGSTLNTLARACFYRGDIEGGRARLGEAMATFESIGADRHVANITGLLAENEFRSGNPERALQLGTQCLAMLRKIGNTYFFAGVLSNLAAYSIALGRWDEARSRAREALERLVDTQHVQFFPFTLQHFVALAVLSPSDAGERAARLNNAARLLGFVNARVAELRVPREFTEQQEYDRILDVLDGTELTERHAAIMEEGAAITASAAIELALAL
jgi:predicted ATPase/DNA-binding CsgD family transcriptional regulator